MTRTRLRASLVNLAVAATTLLLCALVLEAGARFVEWRRVSSAVKSQRESGSAIRFHPLLGWEKTPGFALPIKRPEFEILMKTNSRGLRGPERDYAKPAGTRRVLILGDSFAAGYYAGDDEMLSAVLERGLAAQRCGTVEVLNGGTIAYSTDQEYLFYKSEGRRYSPDVIVLAFYYNDLYYNARALGPQGEPKPHFTLEGPRPEPDNLPLTAPPRGTGGRAGGQIERLPPWRGSLFLRMLARRTSSSAPRLHRLLSRLGLAPPEPSRPHVELSVFGPSPDVPAMWKVTQVLLGALKEEAESHGARLVVLYVPVRFEVNDDVWELTRARYALGPRWRRERVFERLRAACQALAVPLVDPRVALAEAERSGRPAYYSRDVHWTPRGNALAAEAVQPAVARALGCPGPQEPR